MRLASGNVALTATSWGPNVESCPEGPTRLDREIRVGVPARRADGSGRRTAGRWVAPPAVAAVRFSGLRVVGRDSLERDSGRPREFLGALMTPRGPIGREQAGSPASHPDGVLGGRPSQVRAILTGHPCQDRPSRGAARGRFSDDRGVVAGRGRRLVAQRRPKGITACPFSIAIVIVASAVAAAGIWHRRSLTP
jgi:hypothetical protein